MHKSVHTLPATAAPSHTSPSVRSWDEYAPLAADFVEATDRLTIVAGETAVDSVSSSTQSAADTLGLAMCALGDSLFASLDEQFPGYAAGVYLTRGIAAYAKALERLYRDAHDFIANPSATFDEARHGELVTASERLAASFETFRRAAVTLARAGTDVSHTLLDQSLEKFGDINSHVQRTLTQCPRFEVYSGGPISVGDIFTIPATGSRRTERIVILTTDPALFTFARVGETGKISHTFQNGVELKELLLGRVREHGPSARAHPGRPVFSTERSFPDLEIERLPPGTVVRTTRAAHEPRVESEIIADADQGGVNVLTKQRPGTWKSTPLDARPGSIELESNRSCSFPDETCEVVYFETCWEHAASYPQYVARSCSVEIFAEKMKGALDVHVPTVAPFQLVQLPGTDGDALVLDVSRHGALCLRGNGSASTLSLLGVDKFHAVTASALASEMSAVDSVSLARFTLGSGPEYINVAALPVSVRGGSPVPVLDWENAPSGTVLIFQSGHREIVLTSHRVSAHRHEVTSIVMEPGKPPTRRDAIRTNAELSASRGLSGILTSAPAADRLLNQNRPINSALRLSDSTRHDFKVTVRSQRAPFLVSIIGQPSTETIGEFAAAFDGARAVYLYDQTAHLAGFGGDHSQIIPHEATAIPMRLHGGVSAVRSVHMTVGDDGASSIEVGMFRFEKSERVRQGTVLDVCTTLSREGLKSGLYPVTVVLGTRSETWATLETLLGSRLDASTLPTGLKPVGEVILCEGTSKELDRAIFYLRQKEIHHPRLHIVRSSNELRDVFAARGLSLESAVGKDVAELDVLRQNYLEGELPNSIDVLQLSKPAKEVREIINLLLHDLEDSVFETFQKLSSIDPGAADSYYRQAQAALLEVKRATDHFVWAFDVVANYCPEDTDLLGLSLQRSAKGPPTLSSLMLERCITALQSRAEALPVAISNYHVERGFPVDDLPKKSGPGDEAGIAEYPTVLLADVRAACERLNELKPAGLGTAMPKIRVEIPVRIDYALAADMAKLVMLRHGDPSDPIDTLGGVIVGEYSRDTLAQKSHVFEFPIVRAGDGGLDAAIVAVDPAHVTEFVPRHVLDAISGFGRVACLDCFGKRAEASPDLLCALLDRYGLRTGVSADVVAVCISTDNSRSGLVFGSKLKLVKIPGPPELVATSSGGTTSFAWYYYVPLKDSAAQVRTEGARFADRIDGGKLAILNPATFDREVHNATRLWRRIEALKIYVSTHPQEFKASTQLKRAQAFWAAQKDRLALLYTNSEEIVAAVESKRSEIPAPLLRRSAGSPHDSK